MSDDECGIFEMLEAKGKIQFGLCCINNHLRNRGKVSHLTGEKIGDKSLWLPREIFNNRTCIRDTFSVERAKELALQNVKDLIPTLEWNHRHKIKHFRISSDMFPHFTDPVTEKYSMDFATEDLAATGKLANELGHRITCHPGQFCQIASPSLDVFEKTIEDLQMHADILDKMGIDDNGIMCIHGGGVYGDKEATMRRWVERFDELPRAIKRRLALENCEKCYSAEDCLELSEATRIPVIFDSHHYNCFCHYNRDAEQIPAEELMERVVGSWGSRTPVMHVSDQRATGPVGAHHDYVQCIPGYMLEIPYKFGKDIHIEIEAKAKEAAVLKLQRQYHFLF
jgi:UV DNA damage endonuclease